MQESIDIFNIHQKIMDDYKHFVSSFINIKDEKIKEIVETEINQGKVWPEPLIQFNPSFEQGESAQSVCDKGILHPDLSKIFKNYDLFKHQVEAIKKGLISKADIDKSIYPTIITQLKLGLYDDPGNSPYANFGLDSINNSYHTQLESFGKSYTWCPYLQVLPVIGADQNVYPCQDKAYNLQHGLVGRIRATSFKK